MILRSLALILAGLASPALAGDLTPADPSTATRAVPQPVLRGVWSGGYVAGQLSYANVGADDGTDRSTGGYYGLASGYRHDLGRLVLGGEVSYGRTDVTLPNGEDVDNLLRAGVHLGYDMGRLMPYASAGYSAASLTNDARDFEGEYDGAFLGLGLAYQVTDHVQIGGEAVLSRFDADGADADVLTVGGRVAYRF